MIHPHFIESATSTTLPEPSDLYPGPWDTLAGGNGHFAVVDALGREFASVFCWGEEEWSALDAAIRKSGGAGL